MKNLELRGLTKTYPDGTRALDDVSLSLAPGMFGLLGPNGAGKSTLMRTIAGLQTPDEGSLTFGGTDLLETPGFLRERLGYLPQEFGVYRGISAERLLDHLAVLKGVGPRRERREQVAALLERTNLHDVRRRPVAAFSGGMKQRFGIAQALLGSPEVILVDEPTAGLDPEERHRFHNLLAEIGESVVVLLSTHIVSDVRDLCPRMAVLADGRLVLEGEPAELTRRLEGRVWRKTVPRRDIDACRARLSVLSSRLFAGEVRLHVLAEESPGDGFEPIAPQLEDVYFATLRRES